MTPEALLESIRIAEERKAQALAAFQQASAEIAWLIQGLRLLGVESDSTTDTAPAAVLFPPAELFDEHVHPTLRQAIVAVMRPNPTKPWRASELAAELVHQGWLGDTPEATKRVSDMAALMVGDGQMERLARGTYGLAPQLAAELELADLPAASEPSVGTSE